MPDDSPIPIFEKLDAACSRLSHRVGRRWMRPLLQAIQPQAILQIDGLRADQRLVALTIDDAPSPESARILDLLRDHDAKATFFIHGARIESSTEKRLVKRMLDDGHEVGNHMPESVPSIQLKPLEFAAGFERNHRILLDSGAAPVRFRPSHGFHNRPMAEFLRTRGVELGYRPKFYLGLNFPWDAFFEIPGWYARHSARAAVPGRIVVFHDNQDRKDRRGAIINQSQRTLAALPVFFADLEKQGFKARSLADLETAAKACSSLPAGPLHEGDRYSPDGCDWRFSTADERDERSWTDKMGPDGGISVEQMAAGRAFSSNLRSSRSSAVGFFP